MSTARMRSAFSPALSALGFARRGGDFVLRCADVQHVVSVFAARRLPGHFEFLHRVFAVLEAPNGETAPIPLIQDRIRGFREPYLELWGISNTDAILAAKQAAAILGAFRSLGDVAHFYSDRPSPPGVHSDPLPVSVGPTNSLSKSEAEAHLHNHAEAIFSSQFVAAPRLGENIWVQTQQTGGYSYCAYLSANETATLASILYFPFSVTDVQKGRKSDSVLRSLLGTPKRLVSHQGQPVLIPIGDQGFDHKTVSEVLIEALSQQAPNLLRREA